MSRPPSSSRAPLPAELVARPRKPWLSWLLLGGFIVLIAVWLGGKPVMRKWRAWQAAGHVTAAAALMEREEWAEAARLLSEAMSIAPDDPALLSTIVDFQIRTQASANDVVQTLQRLISTGRAGTADLLKLGHAEIRRGNLAGARKALALLPEEARTQSDVIELEAALLKKEGRAEAAEEKLRTALQTSATDAGAPFKLALLDFKQPFSAVRARGRSRLWEFARGTDDTAVKAVLVLAADKELAAAEAEELLRLTEAHPKPGTARQAALTAALPLLPQQRDDILKREAARAAGGDETTRLMYARWLSAVHEHERLLQFLPPETQVKSKSLPVDLLHLKLDALAQTQRWTEVRDILTPDLEKVLGRGAFNLWQACLMAHLEHDLKKARQHLTLAFKATGRGQDVSAALLAAEIAARLGIWDMAASFHEALADQASSPQTRLAMLEKAFTMCSSDRDTTAMLRVARAIATLTPGNDATAFRADYLSLLLGESLEVIAFNAETSSVQSPSESTVRKLFLSGIAAYRLRQPVVLSTLLKTAETSSSWPVGQRAVLAALIAASGDQAAAFRLAERIPTSLLLPEEARLLALAQ